MPAASCRIMPARSISRCETISASFGVSRRIGRKKRDRRIGCLENRVGCSGAAVKADRTRKYKRTKGLAALPRSKPDVARARMTSRSAIA